MGRLPDLSAVYIPTTDKRANSGVAALDSSGVVAQAPKLHAASHATGATDQITPTAIGATPVPTIEPATSDVLSWDATTHTPVATTRSSLGPVHMQVLAA